MMISLTSACGRHALRRCTRKPPMILGRFEKLSTERTATPNYPQHSSGSTGVQQQQRRASSTKTESEASSGTKSSSSNDGNTNKKTSKSFMEFMEWYEEQLSARPVFTKMVTGALLWGLGDAVAQIMPQVAGGGGAEKLADSSISSSSSSSKDNQPPQGQALVEPPPPVTLAPTATSVVEYDWPRTMRAVLFGFALHAPTSHLHYNFLEWMTVRAGITGGIRVPLFKAFMEQFVYWSWISNSMYHGAMGAMQGLNMTQIYHRIEDVLWETQKAQWVFWIPVQLLNFRFVPVRHQLNVVLLTSIVWTALLSAWYPPEKKDDSASSSSTASQKKTEN